MRAPDLSPTVRFEPGFELRIARALAAIARRRAPSEAAGRAWLTGGGGDVVGARAYVPGDDPRAIDWSATARSERPVVRVLRRSAGGIERIVLDASLSMAIGPPGKLQRAAEVAAALAAHAVRSGARAWIHVLPGTDLLELRALADLRSLLDRLELVEASGQIPQPVPRLAPCERATWVGDLARTDPHELARAAPRGCALRVLQMLAPHEIAPEPTGPTTWWEPETEATLAVAVDAGAIAAHQRSVERRGEVWRGVLARRGVRVARATSAEPFEAALRRILGP